MPALMQGILICDKMHGHEHKANIHCYFSKSGLSLEPDPYDY